MLDFTSRETLPKDAFGKVHITLPLAEPVDMGTLLNSGLAQGAGRDNDYNALINLLREDYYACCISLLDYRQGHPHYGDDCGDYMKASADCMTWLHETFCYALWHTELSQDMVDELNLFLNCADEEHCIHQWAIDGPDLHLMRLAVDWEQCPLTGDENNELTDNAGDETLPPV